VLLYETHVETVDMKDHRDQKSPPLQNKLPVTVCCPSVRLLQNSSATDIRRMSCCWKPDNWFHQLCQNAMPWDPWNLRTAHCITVGRLVVTYIYTHTHTHTRVCSSGVGIRQVASFKPHLEEFFGLLSVFCILNFRPQGLVLQDGRGTKGATCKLIWNQTATNNVLTLSPTLSVACVTLILVEELEDLPRR